jgi:hypothetical protein
MNLRRESEPELDSKVEVEDEEDVDDVEASDMVRVLPAEALAVLVSIARLRSMVDDECEVWDIHFWRYDRWDMNVNLSVAERPGGGERGLGLK